MRDLFRAIHDDLVLRLARDRYNALAVARADAGVTEQCPLRMLGRPALAVRGDDGARMFYNEKLVRRHGAVPAPVRLLLFGPGAIHGLDGDRHRERKQIFFRIVTAQSVQALADLVDEALAAKLWHHDVALFDELVDVYGTAVIHWAGIRVSRSQASRISRELALVVDGFGVAGTSYARAALARVRVQKWAVDRIREARSGRSHPAPGSAVQVIASSRLPALVAATELINVLRPTVAVAYFGAQAAVQLAHQPQWRELIGQDSAAHLRAFQLELRRWYPFAPLLAGRTREELGPLPPGSFLVLDILGTNRDPRLWEHPDRFEPARFLEREPGAYDFVPQGGGFVEQGHRCPGGPIAEALLETTLPHLARLDYDLGPDADEVRRDRIPSLPRDRVRLILREPDLTPLRP